MSSSQPVLLAPPHRNQRLFSDHYLDVILPEQGDWKLGGDSAAAVLAELREVFARFVPSANEAQTENDWIRPVLNALGHHYEVQAALRTPDGTKKPDYVLYRDLPALHANKNVVLTDADLQHGIAVADAKFWDRPLDQALKVGNDPFTNKNPGYQIAFYVQHTGLPWGLLTNGRLWRLYHKDSAHKLDRYYEVDLPELLERNDPQAFQYFLRFFERKAFDAGPLSLDRHLQASETYARTVGDTLRDQVYDALQHVAQGFLDFPRNGLSPDADTLKAIYDHSLILLYRLLFVLFAEARGLLPVEESSAYRDRYSLHAIKRAVADDLRYGQTLLPSTCTLWPRLTALFGIINLGSPPLKVATFNGGLFDPQRHPFLEQYSVGDAHLQQAIDKLARVQREFVDYRDLAERHLGTIYEGLLEFQLRALPPEGERTPEQRSAAAAGWSVELVTDKGERKASGSYYTPGFVTRYMVEQAVGPVIDAALANAAPGGTEAQTQAVLAVNVLDCSMGSGHFLVEVVEYLARRLVEADLLPADAHADPAFEELGYWKRRVAQSCVYGVDLNPLAVDLAKLSLWLTTAAKDRPLSFLDHHLRPGNALVGARLDDLAPSATAAAKKSPKGSARTQKREAAGQLTWAADSAFTQSMSQAVGSMWLIEESAAATVADVKGQEKLYAQVREAFTRKYARLADLVTATRFGLRVDEALWAPLTDYAMGRTLAPLPQFKKWADEAAALAQGHRFFHWELEFPEVFFDRFGRPLGDAAGFDVVIGNPPYVRQERLAPLKPYFAAAYPEVYHGMADLFVYFFSQGLRQLQANGRLAYISSNSWLQTAFAEPLRRHVRTTATVESLLDLGNNRTFAEAPDVCPSVFVIVKSDPQPERRFASVVFHRGEAPDLTPTTLARKTIQITQHDQPDSGWQLEAGEGRDLLAKLSSNGTPLGELVGGRLFRGVVTGLNEAFYIDSTTRERLITEHPDCQSIIKPILRGEDLRPWYQEDEGRWLIFARRGIDIDAYPSVRAHLETFRDCLVPRPDGLAASQPWGGRKAGRYKWYELQDTVDYYREFDGPKILWPDIAKIPRFSFDATGKYMNDLGYVIPAQDPALLGFLQSRVAWTLISRLCLHNKYRGGLWEYRLKTQFMARLPIPPMSSPDRETLGALAMQITEIARARYALHQATRAQIQRDLGTPGKALNQKLTAWWELDFATFRAEVQKVFKREIPVRERNEWDGWLSGQRAEHGRLTAEIVALETELNDRVYRLFDLTPEEIRLIEETTKYPYGAV